MDKFLKVLWISTLFTGGILISTLSSAEDIYDYPDYIQTWECPGTKPYLKLPEINTNYYYPVLTKLKWLTERSVPSISERDEFPYESICETLTDPACDIFKIIHERDKMAKEWNTSDVIQYWRNYFLETVAQNESNIKKNDKLEKFQNSEIMSRIVTLLGRKKELEPFIDSGEIVGSVDGKEIRIPYIYSKLIPQTPFQKKAMTYFQSLPDFYTKESLTEWEKERDEMLKMLTKDKEKNDKIVEENQKIEQKNSEEMKKFHDFYTPNKLNQLLNDYDALLKSNCSELPPAKQAFK